MERTRGPHPPTPSPVRGRGTPRVEGGGEGFGSWISVLARTGRLPALVIAIGSGILLYGFLLSGDYAVDDVTVRGAQLGDPVEIAAATGAFGESIFQVESDQIAERIASLPYVDRVQVETRLPSRVVINVTERIPVMVWRTENTPLLLDERGNVLIAGEDADLPAIDSDAFEVEVGGTIGAERAAAALAIYETLGTEIDRVTWSEREGLTARLQDGSLVIFGEPERLPLKLAVYQKVRTSDIAWAILDIREPDRPYYE